jgi:hypothetical protein
MGMLAGFVAAILAGSNAPAAVRLKISVDARLGSGAFNELNWLLENGDMYGALDIIYNGMP